MASWPRADLEPSPAEPRWSASSRPATSSPSSVLAANPNTGIDHTVGEIDDDVGQRDEDGIEDRGPHDHRVIALRYRLHKFTPQSRCAEDRLDDDRAGDKVG